MVGFRLSRLRVFERNRNGSWTGQARHDPKCRELETPLQVGR